MFDIVDTGEPQKAAQLFGGDLHRSGRRRRTRLRLRECRRRCRMEGNVAFYFQHRLVNVPIQNGYRSESPEQGKRLFAVPRAPAPLRVYGPERDMREYDYRGAVGQSFQIVRQPLKLIGAERTQAAFGGIEDVY